MLVGLKQFARCPTVEDLGQTWLVEQLPFVCGLPGEKGRDEVLVELQHLTLTENKLTSSQWKKTLQQLYCDIHNCFAVTELQDLQPF